MKAHRDISVAALLEIFCIKSAAVDRLADNHYRKVCLLRRNHFVVTVDDCRIDRVVIGAFCCHFPGKVIYIRNLSFRDIDFWLSAHRQRVVMVLEHYHRLELGEIAVVAELLTSNCFNSLCRIEVRILEQTCAEEVHKEFFSGMFKSCPGAFFAEVFYPHVVGCDDRTFFVISAELVAPGLDHLVVALVNCESFYAPWFASVNINLFVVPCNAPVGAYDSFVTVCVVKKVLDDVSAECIGYILSRWVLCV